MTELDGQRVLVIGGGRGIGAAIATRARHVGMDVVVGVRDPRTIEGAVRLDLTDEASIAAAATKIGAVDHVVTLGLTPTVPRSPSSTATSSWPRSRRR